MSLEICLANQTNQALVGGFDRYLNYVYSLPILSEKEESELFQKYHQQNDLQAVRQLVLSHLRFVAYVAKSYQGYGLPLEDLIQEGSVGLMKSVKRFDYTQGVRLASYAIHWIKSEIQEYIIKNWQLVKIATTKAHRKLFFNLRSMKKSLGWMSNDEVQEVADYLKVTPEDVRQMELRMSTSDSAIEDSFKEGEISEKHCPAGSYADTDQTQGNNPLKIVENEQFQQRFTEQLTQQLNELDERSKSVLYNRWLVPEEQKLSLRALADKFGISIERVRQIEVKAMKDIRKKLTEAGLSYV